MRSSSRLMTSVYKVAVVASVVVCVLVLTSETAASKSREAGEESDPSESRAISGKTEFVYKNRWQNHNHQHHHSASSPQDSTNDLHNTIDDFGDSRPPLSSSSSSSLNSIDNEPGRQYACGQPLANRKPLVFDRGDQYPSSSSSSGGRSKYRPFEIRMPRIIGGDETDPGEFPWTVSVKLNGQPICGGSLIDESWILTAAHCVVGYNPRNLTVRLGAYRIKDTSETQTVDSPLSLFIVHKEYSMPRPFSNDIALLKMAEPIRYSDYIIPICLPTEDQASVSGDLLQDYNRMLPGAPAASMAAAATTATTTTTGAATDGIVISTKMSDKEISRCFKRLEQNYLNSIGMGAANSAESAAAAPEEPIAIVSVTTHSPALAYVETGPTGGAGGLNHQDGNHYNSMPLDLPPPPPLPPQRLANTHNHGTVTGPSSAMFAQTGYDTPTYSGHVENEIEPQTGGGQDKISFASSSSSSSLSSSSLSADQFDPTMTGDYTSQTFATITNNQHQQSSSSQNRNRLINNQANYLHHGLPLWDQLQSRSSSNNNNDGGGGGGHSQFDYGALEGQQKAAIKLTSLPISKELLREIQSVGSMQSLNLGLQQGDIVAMASDLGGAAAASPADSLLSAQLPTGNAANNRERVITTVATVTTGGSVGGGGGGGAGTRRVLRNPVRASEFSNDLGDGSSEEEMILSGGGSTPPRYSGLSGIVVGWGWVRENDNDEQVGTTGKGFQSVTLQKVRLPILRNNECEAWFRSQEKKITLLPSQFCAGFNLGGKDACRGDSGGPMIIEDNSDSGRYKLIGIVSAGIGCARPSLPGLYTRVASFLPWINAQMTRY